MGIASLAFAASAATNLTNSYMQSRAIKQQGEYEQGVADMNARYMDIQADDAIERGNTASGRVRGDAARFRASQRAAMGASGVDVNVGSPMDVQADTKYLGELDASTIKNNAWREAWGYRSNADILRYQGRMAKNAAKFNAKQTMLTGGMNAARDVMLGASMSKGFGNTYSADQGSISRPSSYGAPAFSYGNRLRMEG